MRDRGKNRVGGKLKVNVTMYPSSFRSFTKGPKIAFGETQDTERSREKNLFPLSIKSNGYGGLSEVRRDLQIVNFYQKREKTVQFNYLKNHLQCY